MTKLLDQIGRKIDYLRVSVTDRCNLRCHYCMPEEGIPDKSHDQILSYEELVKIITAGVELGISKVRVTGGEPLARLGLVEFIQMINQIPGLTEISMTTNGILLSQYANQLKAAGLKRVNISLDTLHREKYQQITRRDQFEQVMAGIYAALEVGFHPVKINVVAMRGVNDDEIMNFVQLARQEPLHIRFIEFMPLGASKEEQSQRYISLEKIKEQIEEEVELLPTEVKSFGPAEHYQLPDGKGSIGFITPISHNFCASCNRLRLTADGKLRPCLDHDLEIHLRDETGKLGDQNQLQDQFTQAILLKPACHHFLTERDQPYQRSMSQIGG